MYIKSFISLNFWARSQGVDFHVSGEHPRKDVTLNGNQFLEPIQKIYFMMSLPTIAKNRNVTNLTQNVFFSMFFQKKEFCNILFLFPTKNAIMHNLTKKMATKNVLK
jgi:hypothetical protein